RAFLPRPFCFRLDAPSTTEVSTLSLHDALPILSGLSGAAASNATLAWLGGGALSAGGYGVAGGTLVLGGVVAGPALAVGGLIMSDRKSTRLNSSHVSISYAVFCLKKKKQSKL